MDLPSAKKGGSLGVVKRGKVFPEIWRILIKLKEGEISDVIETKYGYNILTLDKVISPETTKSFEEVRKEIKKTILQRKRDKAFDEIAAILEEDAEIIIHEHRLDGIVR